MSPRPTPPPPGDDELLAQLARAVGVFDPPPSDLTAANKDLLSWRDPDAALAELVADSRELAGAARGPDDEVVLRFERPEASIIVQVSGTGTLLLLGQIQRDVHTPGRFGTVALHRPGTETVVSCDDLGRFRIEDVPPGPARFRWTPPGDTARSVDTAWTLL